MNRTTAYSLAAIAACAPVTAFALGLRIPDQDPHAIARGNAFVATADNPSAVFYNPAGITQGEGHQASAGLFTVTMNSQRTAPNGAKIDTEDAVHAVPEFYYTYSTTNFPVAAGLGVYMPYGLGMEWPQNSTFSMLTTKGELEYLTINPVVAWRICPQLSIAAGPTVNIGDTTLESRAYRFSGDDVTPGFNAGIRWQPHEKHSVGLTYRSATTLDFTGDYQRRLPSYLVSPDAHAEIDFPQQIVAGYSFRPTPNWNIEFDIDWTDWDALNTVQLLTSSGGLIQPMAFNYTSSFMYEWGVTRYFSEGWSVSGGYMFSENSVPTEYWSPAVPDSDRHIFSVGVGKTYRRFQFDAAYQFAYGPDRDIVGRNTPLYQIDGEYRFLSHAIALSVRYNF